LPANSNFSAGLNSAEAELRPAGAVSLVITVGIQKTQQIEYEYKKPAYSAKEVQTDEFRDII
jgi:hypothetical protein